MQALTYDVRKTRMTEEDEAIKYGAASLIQSLVRAWLARLHMRRLLGQAYIEKLSKIGAITLPSESLSRSAHKIDDNTLLVPYKSTRLKPKPAWEQAFEVGLTSGKFSMLIRLAYKIQRSLDKSLTLC